MSIPQPGTIPLQEELLPNARRSRSGRSTSTGRDKMRQKDREHFGIQEAWKYPSLESIFSQSDFQGLAVGTYGEISSNVRKMVSIAVEYGYKHLPGRFYPWLASDLDAVKNSIRRRFHTRTRTSTTIAIASWRGYMRNMLLGWGGFSTLGRPMPSKRSRLQRQYS